MSICPKCNAENRPEAAFCANCGTILLAPAVPTKPIRDFHARTHPIRTYRSRAHPI
jgi:ribosomal protein L40E